MIFPPPQLTAYFCARRKPGIVLRVSKMFTLLPDSNSISSAVLVAVPEKVWIKFRAVRSPARIAQIGPLISHIKSLDPTFSPSSTDQLIWSSLQSKLNTFSNHSFSAKYSLFSRNYCSTPSFFSFNY